jgi:anti-anti-sigma factor
MSGDSGVHKRRSPGLSVERVPFPDESVTLFNVAGELDHTTSEVLDTAIRTAVDNGCSKLVLDLSQTVGISPGGIDVVVQSWFELRESRGHLILLNPHPAVKEALKTLEALRLARQIKTVASMAEAVEFFSQKPSSRPN